MKPVRPVPARVWLIVALLLILASVTAYQSGVDVYLARSIVSLEGGTTGFAWEHSYWLDDVLHEGGRYLVKRLYFLNLALLLLSFFIRPLKPWRQAFTYIAVATTVSTSAIASLKHLTTLPCPVALSEFGGTRAWVDLVRMFSPELPVGRCYPAGHASGGYAWICLAFLFPPGSRKFFLALVPGLLLGMVFGLAQQLRGYHFLSHDLLPLAFCWTTSSLLAFVFGTVRESVTRVSRMILPLEDAP